MITAGSSSWVTEQGVGALVVLMQLQDEWRALSYGGREALLNPQFPGVHGNTIRSLTRKGLWADGKPTPRGAAVADFRPGKRDS